MAASLVLAPAAFATAGDFTAAPSSPEASGADNPAGVSIGDFDGDGRDDLAVSHANPTGEIAILLGGAGGDFTAAPTSPEIAGSGPSAAGVGDFDGNGTADLAVAINTSVVVFLGNGAGDFTAAPTSPEATGGTANSLAVGDFNADGKADLAVTNGGAATTVRILLGAGDGDFSPAATSPEDVGGSPDAVAVGDFNADGTADLAVTRPGSDNVTILLGVGGGDFVPAPTSPETTGDVPREVVVGDLNGDGLSDLAIVNQVTDDVTVLLGVGGGDFVAPPTGPEPGGDTPVGLAIGDFEQNGVPDLAVVNTLADTVTPLIGVGGGDFSPAITSPEAAGNGPQMVVVGDFNQDGVDDLAASSSDADGVTILLGAAHQLGLNPTGFGGGFVESSPAGLDCSRNVVGHSACAKLFASGAQITLTAHPDKDSGFEGFLGGGCSGAEPTCTVTLNQLAVVNAIFTDIAAPQTRITKKPRKTTTKAKAKFKFTASEKKATFTCKLDKTKAKRCSGQFRKRVKPGKHVFRVLATDAAGNADRTPAKMRWRVLED